MSFPVNSTWGPCANSSSHHPHYIRSDVNQRKPNSMKNNPVLTALPIYQPPQPRPHQSLQPHPFKPSQPRPHQSLQPHPHQQMGAPPHQRIEMPQEDVLVVNKERSLFSARTFVRWTPELERRFTGAVQELGGAFRATPNTILKKMKVNGLTSKHIKSHLQKVRNKCKSRISLDELTAIRNSLDSALELSRADADLNGAMNVNGNGLQSFVQDIEAYGRLLGSSETPTFRQYLESGHPSTEDIDLEL